MIEPAALAIALLLLIAAERLADTRPLRIGEAALGPVATLGAAPGAATASVGAAVIGPTGAGFASGRGLALPSNRWPARDQEVGAR